MNSITINAKTSEAVCVGGLVANRLDPITVINPNLLYSSNSFQIKYHNRRDIEIADVNIIVPYKVVEVTFTNGDKQKTVCDDADTFSLENAISFAITKQLLGGTSSYNKAIRDGLKVYEDKLKSDKWLSEREEIIEKKKEKNRKKKEAWKRRKAEQRKEEQIAIQAEAYVRAMSILEQKEMDEIASGS